MDKKAFDEIEARLLEVNKLVQKLDGSIRVAAFEFLKPYIAGGTFTAPKPKGGDDHGGGDAAASDSNGDLEELVKKHSDLKPNETHRCKTEEYTPINQRRSATLKCLRSWQCS